MHRRTCVTVASAVLALSTAADATDFYVSAAGSDSNPGSMASPWQSMAAVAGHTFAPGDVVHFRRGDTFRGGATVTESGTATQPIVFTAYGTGATPILSGLTDVTGWRSIGSGVYEATLPARTTMLNVVMRSGAIQPIGRYPRASDPDLGYLFFETRSGSTSITDNELTGTPNFVGAELVIRTEQFVFNRGVSVAATSAGRVGIVQTQTGGTLTFLAFPDGASYPLTPLSPYFFQNCSACLLDAGDWMFDAASGVIRMRATSAPTDVQAATVDRILAFDGASHVRVEDLAFLGANDRAVSTNNGADVTVQRCTFDASGNYAMQFQNTDNVTVAENTVRDSLSNGVRFYGPQRMGFVARDNLIERTGMIAGMGEPARNTYQALQVRVGSGATLERNVIRGAGYNGINFQGNSITIRNNVIEHFNTVLDDGGGIYTWNEAVSSSGPPVFTDRLIEGNIVRDGVGVTVGPRDTALDCSGIYLDLDPMNVRIVGNTVYGMPDRGMTFNNPIDVEVRGNNLWNNSSGLRITRWPMGQTPSGFTSTDNVIVAVDPANEAFGYHDSVPSTVAPRARLGALGMLDGNYVGGWSALMFTVEYNEAGTTLYPDRFHLPGWRDFSGLEATSHALPTVPRHRITSDIGPELYPAGSFTTSRGGASSTGTLVWDASTPYLAITDPMPAPHRWPPVVAPFGAVTAGHAYRLRVTVRSPYPNGILRAYLRNAASPWAQITPNVDDPLVEGESMHEFLMIPTESSPNAAWVFRVMAGSMPIEIDDVSVVEVNGTALAFDDTVRFEVNDTNADAVRALPDVYTDARGGVHDRSITLAPYSSAVLFPGGTVVPTDGGITVDASSDGSVADVSISPDATVDAATPSDAVLPSDARLADGGSDADGGHGAMNSGCQCRAGRAARDRIRGSITLFSLMAALAIRRKRAMNTSRKARSS